jgi:transaldolase
VIRASHQWLGLANAGARPTQHVLLGEHRNEGFRGHRRPLHGSLSGAFTINTIPAKTLKAFAELGKVGEMMPANGGDTEEVLAEFANAEIDRLVVAEQLQRDGAEAFDESWRSPLASIKGKVRR